MEKNIKTKIELSKFDINIQIGFLYWINETHNLRGLKSLPIESYPTKIRELKDEYLRKYPNGLTGWNE